MENRLNVYLARSKGKVSRGIYSVCSSHPLVIRASAEQAVADGSYLLVEATSNQVNQFGGYSGMRPADFRRFVEEIVTHAGLSLEKLILGGDHLGPNPWKHENAEEAMTRAEVMVAEFATAGFTKIHLDASMSCADDPTPLPDATVATRAARLAKAAEKACKGDEAPVYIIGTEVPTPGGATHALDGLQVTTVEAAEQTWNVHEAIFAKEGLADAWPRVIALVVQPGVEFAHDSVIAYDRDKARALKQWFVERAAPLVFEAHSTDYQPAEAYPALVEDGFSILKVGPALTFAVREALYALEDIEQQLLPEAEWSRLSQTMEAAMLANPKDWQGHYHGAPAELHLLRVYSYSDRMRYYWHYPQVADSVQKLIGNLEKTAIPEVLLSRYLPDQYRRRHSLGDGQDPTALVVDKVRDVLKVYAAACV